MAEVLSKRTRYQKVFDDPAGANQYRAEVHAGGVHFLGEDDQWHDMDGLLVGGETTAKDIKYGFVAQHAGATRSGKYMGFKPTGLVLYDAATGQTEDIEDATIGTPVITGNTLDLADVYTDQNLEVIFDEFTMAKWWHVATRPTLPDPASLGMDPATTYLVWTYSMKTTGGTQNLVVKETGQEWDGSLYLGEISVQDRNDVELYWFRQGTGRSDAGRQFDVHYAAPSGHDFGEAVAYSDIQAATYPIVVDPSTTVYAGYEDGSIDSSNNVDTSSTFHSVGRANFGKGDDRTIRYYCRVDLSSLDSGDTCDSATLSLYYNAKAGTTTQTYTAKLYTTDWGATLTSGDWGQAGTDQGNITGTAFTPGYNDWSLTDSDIEGKFGGVASFELYSSDESYAGGRYIQVRSADVTGTTNDPKMSITYTEGGGGDVTVGKDSLVLAGKAPALGLGWNGAVGADTLAIAGKQPVVTAGSSVSSDVTVGLDTLSVAGLQPVVTTTVSIPSDVTVGLDTLVVSGKQPVVTTTTSIASDVTVGLDTLSVTGLQPVVTTTTVIDADTTVGLDSLVVSGLQPVVTTTTVIDSDVTVGLDTLSISGKQPTVVAGSQGDVVVGLDTLVIAGQAPVVTTDENLTVGADALAITGLQPVVTAGTVVDSDVTVGLDTLSISGKQPTVATGIGSNVTVGADALVIAGKQPTTTRDQYLIPLGFGTISITGLQPSITAGGLTWTCETLPSDSWTCETMPTGLVYLVDGDGNYIVDGNGNYIVVGEGSGWTTEASPSSSWTEESI